VDGAAFNFEQVDAEPAERFEGGEESAGLMSQAKGEGHFQHRRRRRLLHPAHAKLHHDICYCRGRGSRRIWRIGWVAFALRRNKQNKASEILVVVLDVGSEDDAAVVFRGAAAGDGCGGFVAAGQGFADAAGSVFGRDALEMGMRGEEAFALRERHGMTRDGAEVAERGAGATDKAMLNWEDSFRNHTEIAGKEQVVDANDRARKGILDGREKSVGGTFLDGPKGGIKSGARYRSDSLAKKLKRCFFAEGAWLTLESYAHFKDDSTPRHGHRVRPFL
jgi:hypothetical protein